MPSPATVVNPDDFQEEKILLVFVYLKFITSENGDSPAVLMTVPIL